MIPMFLAYKPPQMLPTETLNPVAQSTGKAKRDESRYTGILKASRQYMTSPERDSPVRAAVWWMGFVLVSMGAGALLFSKN